MDATAEAADPLRAGQALASERERQGLSRVEIAQRLHMSPSQVEALETGEYSRLPKGPFLRGFVRNYAKALGLDTEALLAQLAQESPAESAPRIVVPSQNIRFDPLGDRFSSPYVRATGLAVVAIALGFAAMYWWLFIRPTPPAMHKPTAEAPPVTSTTATPSGTPSPASMPGAPGGESPAVKVEPGSAASAPPAAPAPARSEPSMAAEPRATEAPKAAAPAKGEAQLQFRFKGESWVEVREANDKVIFQRLNPAGTEATVTGRKPLRVIVGNASEVTLRYNDRDFPLEPHTQVAVARFTLE